MKHDYPTLSNQQLAQLVRDYPPRSAVSKAASQELMVRNTQLKQRLRELLVFKSTARVTQKTEQVRLISEMVTG
jgi:hypothetical protein